MTPQEIKIAAFILASKKLPGIGSKTVIKILKATGSQLQSCSEFTVDCLRLLEHPALNRALDKIDQNWKQYYQTALKVIEGCLEKKIHVLHPFMKQYPYRLLVNDNFPPLLFGIGDVTLLNSEKLVAIIGTREPTELGKKLGKRLATVLADEGYVIVSGLALGSDSIGHLGALASQNGQTIAILPTQIGANVYPKQNEQLAEQIVKKGGLLISEYAPNERIEGRQLVQNLINRDEWQPGISDGLIVIETSLTGGSNHAIRHAIATQTPIGAFDYQSKIGDIFTSQENFAGNIQYINQQKALPIYSEESVQVFKKQMNDYRDRIKLVEPKIIIEPTKETSAKREEIQINLF